jgi:hypothetical protein
MICMLDQDAENENNGASDATIRVSKVYCHRVPRLCQVSEEGYPEYITQDRPLGTREEVIVVVDHVVIRYEYDGPRDINI